MPNSTISFILDDEVVNIDFNISKYSPTTTVLHYLRSLPNHKGVKEGCGEGDCGACTVVIAELTDNNLQYKAYNSCLIFLPMLHAKQLITIENLGTSENLHPIQKSFVENYASQCGFCTPGFIMSLFALYKNKTNPANEDITDAIAGNLCRCTGYRPIIDAAKNINLDFSKDKFSKNEPKIKKLLNQIIKTNTSHKIHTEKQKYYLPYSINEAITLKEKNQNAIIINGGTDIALRVTKNNEELNNIIDISNIQSLKQINNNKSSLKVGAGISIELLRELSKVDFPALYSVLSVFGSKQIRNKATIGGNIASASPIGDSIPVLMAYNAIVHTQNIKGKKSYLLREFITAYRTTKLKHNELITSIEIPKNKKKIVKAYKISKRKDLDISTVSGSFSIELTKNNNVKALALFFGGMAAYTKRAEKTEEYLLEKQWNRKNIESAMKILYDEFSPLSDARSGEQGRKIMARNLLMKFWLDTICKKTL